MLRSRQQRNRDRHSRALTSGCGAGCSQAAGFKLPFDRAGLLLICGRVIGRGRPCPALFHIGWMIVVATREPAFGLSDHGISTRCEAELNFGTPQPRRQACAAVKFILAKDGPLVGRPASTPAVPPRTSSRAATRTTESNVWWDNNAAMSPVTFRRAEGGLPDRAREARIVRRRPLWRFAGRASRCGCA